MSLFDSARVKNEKRLEEGLGWDSKQRTDGSSSREERQLLVPKHASKTATTTNDNSTTERELISQLFHSNSTHHSWYKTHPSLPPEKRGKRHRHRLIFNLNQFRHWWKTSRLLVRLAGAFVCVWLVENWHLMASWNIAKHRQFKKAWKFAKYIGRGGTVKPFLAGVQPFTRTIRLILAIARALEARVDHRMVEVGFAEAFAFMGNRCSRYWARHLTDWTTQNVMLPLALTLEWEHARPFIIMMGFIRAILPFLSSFQGSRFGRQVTYSTFHTANHRWKAIQSVSHFHEKAGVYKDTDLDQELLTIIRQVAESMGHSKDPVETRRALHALGFHNIGSGVGGQATYRAVRDDTTWYTLNVTPYGPAILDEMPRFVHLERRQFDMGTKPMVAAACKPNAFVQGLTYSGSYFQAQEWASLKRRFERELDSYTEACRIMGTAHLPSDQTPQKAMYSAPPFDLRNLKGFLRSGHPRRKQNRDKSRMKQIDRMVSGISKVLQQYERKGRAPKEVILYFEGLDCAGKSSTGNLIANALSESGYTVTIAQHNRPPTPEQRSKPWMDRGRFEYPEDMFREGKTVPKYSAVIWDRGPAGDFVYGAFRSLSDDEKIRRFQEFKEYDQLCSSKGVLFMKLFFVSDRDSIAATLGKRLAQKRIADELKTWLDANSVPHFRDGLNEIEHHIDPTDFIAFNKYEENLERFTEFVRNTDSRLNPWIVVNTSDRHAARKGLLKEFKARLGPFIDNILTGGSRPSEENSMESDMMKAERKLTGMPPATFVKAFLLLVLLAAYIHQTWKVDFMGSIWDD